MWPGKRKVAAHDDVLGDRVGDDGRRLSLHDRIRRRLDGGNDCGRVGHVGLPRTRAHGNGDMQHGKRGSEDVLRLGGGGDGHDGHRQAELTRALGEDLRIGKNDKRPPADGRPAAARRAA